MKYILVVLLVCFCSTTSDKETKNAINLIINYEGDIDKPLPKIIFCKDCNDKYDFRAYQFKMDENFFKSTNNFLLLNKYSKKRENTTVLSIIIDNNEKIYLQRKEAKLFIEKLIKLSHKDMLDNQLFKYLLKIN